MVDTNQDTKTVDDPKSADAPGAEPKLRFEDLPGWAQDRIKTADSLEKANVEREAEAKTAARDAEIKKAEGEKRYEDAARLKEEAHNLEVAGLRKELVTSNLRSELAVAGFEKRGVDLLASEYDSGKHESIADYVKASLADDGNKPFLSGKPRLQFRPPSEVVTGGGTGTLTNEQIKAMQKSDKQEDRIAAQKYLEKIFKETNSLPPGFADG